MSTTWTAAPQDVERLISAVTPHVESDGYYPALNCVHVELTADTFLAVATDRYTLGISWSALEEWNKEAESVEPLSANIHARDLRRLFTFLKPHKKLAATWTLTEEALTVTAGGESLSVRPVIVDFVKWRGLLPKLIDRANAAVPAMAFDPIRVGAFNQSAKALGERLMSWQFGGAATDAPVVRIGENFVGVLMPVRIPDELPTLDLSAIGIEGPSAVAA
jgi:hypothetical protein